MHYMHTGLRTRRLVLVAWLCLVGLPWVAQAQTPLRTVARLIWQDASQQTLHWADLKTGEQWQLSTASVDGFPTLDNERQSFVQLQTIADVALSGIRDTENGEFQSGWVAIESGVRQEAHGDHFHWHYDGRPRVLAMRLDDQQGNPAHVYTYGSCFYLANDKKNGFTRVVPSALRTNAPQAADEFISAGGGHITLAAVDDRVVYATWIDRDGENLGRVDVVGIGSQAGRHYQFRLPSGGIHGATANSGKVFFAPSDGVCWVAADTSVTRPAGLVDIQHISLGQDAAGMPKRTGAFENSGRHVLFTVGRGDAPELCMLDAASPKPQLLKLNLTIASGNSLMTPKAVQSRTGEHFALLVEESQSGEQAEKLHVVALDPNRDGQYTDAKLRTSLTVGRSLIEGHSGHHDVAPIGRRFVVVTNPGDGTLSIVSTSDWETVATMQVGGTPTRITAIGG